MPLWRRNRNSGDALICTDSPTQADGDRDDSPNPARFRHSANGPLAVTSAGLLPSNTTIGLADPPRSHPSATAFSRNSPSRRSRASSSNHAIWNG